MISGPLGPTAAPRARTSTPGAPRPRPTPMARPALARLALSLGLLWLAAGALYKLFEGSPNDLPKTVMAASPLGALETMRLAIAIELAVIGLVIALPRVGWFFLAGTFAVFLAVLAPLVASGEESCGCFGGNITIEPWKMMVADGLLLALILATKPWRTVPREAGLGLPALWPMLAVDALAPHQKLQPAKLPTLEPRTPAVATPGVTDGANPPSGTATDVAVMPTETPNGEAETTPPVTPPTEATPEATPAAGALPEFFELRVADWVGQDPWATDLLFFYEAGAAAGFAQGAFLPNSHVILYRQTCEHCKEHLEQVWQEVQGGDPKWQGRPLVLVRLEESKDTPENNVCTVLPEPSEKITFPALKRGYGLTTPYSFDLDESGMLQNPVDLRTKK